MIFIVHGNVKHYLFTSIVPHFLQHFIIASFSKGNESTKNNCYITGPDIYFQVKFYLLPNDVFHGFQLHFLFYNRVRWCCEMLFIIDAVVIFSLSDNALSSAFIIIPHFHHPRTYITLYPHVHIHYHISQTSNNWK